MTRPVVSPPDSTEAERVAEIQARVDAATEGPWEYLDDPGCPGVGDVVLTGNRMAVGKFVLEPDAMFIAHAREDIPYLLGLLAARPPVSAAADTLREALERIAEQQQKTLRMIQDNGFVFDSIGQEPGNWQHLAFTIYTDLCEVDTIARAALAVVLPSSEPADETPDSGTLALSGEHGASTEEVHDA